MKYVQTCGFKRTQSNEIPGQWARISGNETIVQWDEDARDEQAVDREKLDSWLAAFGKKLENLAEVLKAICNLSSA